MKNLNHRQTLLLLFILSFLLLFGSKLTSINAVERISPMQKALTFFAQPAKSSSSNKVRSQIPHLRLKYKTKTYSPSTTFVYQKEGEKGYVVILQTGNETRVVGYSLTGCINDTILPPAFEALVKSYEQIGSFNTPSIKVLTSTKETAIPLLDEAGVVLNQFGHEFAGGNCPTGCVATAMTMVMAYHKFPDHGIGSHCYTHKKYGQLCADFANTTYNWVNPTDDDYLLLSYHVGIAMDMNYCGATTGSYPDAPNYHNTLHDYFGYSVYNASTATEDIMMEIDQKRPVYCEISGDPSHAIVADGYNDANYLHLNFGWGGQYNGYFLMNTNTTFNVGYTFGTNIRNALNVSKTAFVTNQSDSLALVAVHNALNGTTRWDLTKPVILWPGVKVVGSRVVELLLGNVGYLVQGNIAPEVSNLPFLRVLVLNGTLNGTLPQSVFNLTKLSYLDITNSTGNIRGNLPTNIVPQNKFKYLSLANLMEGEIPPSIQNLSALSSLSITLGKLSGSIPATICNLTNLTTLNLSSNQLTGAIPAQLGKLSGITSLSLNGNQLTGTIPPSLGRMTNLDLFVASKNKLSGVIPDSLQNLTKLTFLDVKNNALSGDIPASLNSCGLLNYIDLSSNSFTSLCPEIGNLQKLQTLNVSANKLTTLPQKLNSLPALATLYAQSNKISTLPDNFGAMKGIVNVDLSNNALTVFPEGFCYTSNLTYLNLDNNKIERFPSAIGMISQKLDMLRLVNNEMTGTVPASLLNSPMTQLLLSQNHFRFEDIPATDSTFLHDLGTQKIVPLTTKRILVQLGDTVLLDAKKLSGLTRPGNIYTWCEYVKSGQNDALINTNKPDSVLKLVVDSKNINSRYLCRVNNNQVPQWRYAISPGYFVKNAVLPSGIETDTISLKLATEKEILAEKYADSHVVISGEISAKELGDKKVTLLASKYLRGNMIWQASQDGKTWSEASTTMSDNGLKQNIASVSKEQLVLTPKIAAYYRTKLTESGCNPIYSDSMKIKPFGLPVCDTTVNVSKTDKTIKLDSVEVTIPQGLSNSDIRLTIVRADNFTVKPVEIKSMSPVYEMSLSCGTTFDHPLIIKFKNLKKNQLTDKNFENYRPAYFDDALQEWVFYDNANIDMSDSTLTFKTYHLTKLAWFEYAHAGYTHIFTNDRVNVIYKYGQGYPESNYIDLYNRKAALDKNDWYTPNTDPDNNGTPYMIQDIAYYGQQVVDKFKELGLKSSSLRTNIYLKSLGGTAAGMTDAGSFLAGRGYFYIDPQFIFATNDNLTDIRDNMRTTLAHEYMHLTQDYYMTVLLQNYFWMEATAPLADRMVWNETDLVMAEPQKLLEEAYETKSSENSIFDILCKPWNNSYNLPVASKIMANSADINLASMFLHYMRSYREGTKLDAAALLKETSYLESWVGYLNSFIESHLKSTVGNEFENYIKYILSGTNDKFTLLNKEEGNPFGYIVKNVSSCPSDGFGKSMVYQFKTDDRDPQVDKISLSIPTLATKVVMLTNATTDRVGTIVQYKRLHTIDKDCKVYLGQYNLKTKKVDLTDITDSLKYTTYLEPRTEISLENANNSACLVFINKKAAGLVDVGNTFSASFELTAMPMANIADVKYACVSDRFIHSYTSSQYKFPFYISGVYYSVSHQDIVMYNLSDYTSTKTILSDSTYAVNVSFKKDLHSSNGAGMPLSMQHSEITQHIEYNCSSGLLTITQNNKTINRFSAYHDDFMNEDVPERLSGMWVQKTTLVLKGVFVFNSVGNNELVYSTKNSAETRQVVQRMEDQVDDTSYDINGEVSSQSTRRYSSTDYSQGEVQVYLWVHYK